ncbi:MAG: DUF4091 domain-containing protein [Phycisphaerae bacterium]|nr:DUF4091 domain-containing protein [Phycisphaerae bacterium]
MLSDGNETTRRTLLSSAIWIALITSATGAVPLVQVGRGPVPEVDGKLTDAAWSPCAQLMPFILMDGDGLAAAQTRALILYDADNLYVGFRCDEPSPNQIVANNTTHDGALWHDDCVELFIRRSGSKRLFHIIVNSVGATYEARDEETGWSPALKAAAFKDKDSWSVELAIPFSALGGAPGPGEAWRANFCRERKVKSELSSWSCARGRFSSPGTFGEILFAEKPVRVEAFDLSRQLPGANTATLRLIVPDGAAAEIRVSDAKPVAIPPRADGPVTLTYPLGLADGNVTFEALLGKRTVWRSAIPVRIRPQPQLAKLDRVLGPTRSFLASLAADDPLRPTVQTAVDHASRAADGLRGAIDRSLAENARLDAKEYERLNRAAGVEAARLNRIRWPIWTQSNWLDLKQSERPGALDELGQLDVKSLVNEYESANFIITNLSNDPLRLRVTASDLTWFTESDRQAKNVVANGTFEADANKDGIPDGWQRVGGNRKAWRMRADPHRGQIIELDTATSGKLTIRQNLTLVPDEDYVLEFWAKASNATPSLRVGVVNSGWTRAHFSQPITGSHGWRRFRRQITPKESKLHQLVIWVEDGGGGTVWIDNVQLCRGKDSVVEFPDAAPQLAVADWQELRTGSVVADPLIPLNPAGRLDVPPGESRQVWITLPARDLPPGHYECTVGAKPLATIVDQGSPAGKTVRLSLDVRPLRLGTSPDFAVYNWDYARDESYVRDLFDHKVNFYLVPTGMPAPKFDKTGKPLGEMDFSSYDRVLRIKMRYARKAGGQILFAYGIIRDFQMKVSKRYGWTFMDEAWVRAFRWAYGKWLAHLKDLGLGYDEFCVQVWDEATGENVRYVVEGGKLLREIDPKVRLVMDGAQSVEEVRRMDPVIDVWVPHLNKLLIPKVGAALLAEYRKTGKPIYTYTCSVNMKALPPYTYHRLKPWYAARLGLDGVFYWDYSSWRGDPWDDFDGPIADCGAVYDGASGPITSRRWEASREGIEDWQIIRLLGRLADTPGHNAPPATKARKLIDEALDRVLSKKDQRELANEYRIRLIDAAVALAERDPFKVLGADEATKDRAMTVTFKLNRPGAGKLIYRAVGETVWRVNEFAETTEGSVRATLPPFCRGEWMLIAWDRLGRVAVHRKNDVSQEGN